MPPLRQMPRIPFLTLTVQAVERFTTIPRRTKSFDIQARQARDVRMAFVEGGTIHEPYWTLKSGTVYYKDFPLPLADDLVIYFRDLNNAGTLIEIVVWEEDR